MTRRVQLSRQEDGGGVEKFSQKNRGKDGEIRLRADDDLNQGLWKTSTEQTAKE